MNKKKTNTGKELERRVAQAYRDLGARKVEHDVEMLGHQIDVYVELETPDRALHRIAVEVKDYSSPVGINVIRDFSNVVARLRRESLIDEGVIVSAVGFTRPARNAIQGGDIRLLESSDLGAMTTSAERELCASAALRSAVSSASILPCPYRGLFAFREQDAPYFFGREAFVENLAEAVEEHPPIITVFGPSGSGKSSVISAGLVPRLRQKHLGHPSGNEWIIAQFRPADDPFSEIADSLLSLLEPEIRETDRLIEIPRMTKALMQDSLILGRVVERILRKTQDSGQLLLVIDQFEELYTLCSELETRQRFLDVLLTTLQNHLVRRNAALTVVIVLRADFLGRALAYRPFADALDATPNFMLGPMTREELEAAVVYPSEQQGVTLEDGLVNRILDDLGDEPGHLPLLEFALTRLWEHQVSGSLTHATYEAIGKVTGALTHYADQVYSGLKADQKEQARRVFMQLVQPGERTEDTRRLVTRDDLGENDWTIVQTLADARLVVTDRNPAGKEVAEVAHEALIQDWGQLRAWMAEDRAFRVWQERLRVTLAQWEATNQDPGALLRGKPLAEAESWLLDRPDDLGLREMTYLQTSLDARERAEREYEEQRKKEKELAAERRAAEKLRQLNDQLQQEIAERVQMEDALRESEEKLQAVLNATTESVLLLDDQGVILSLNQTAAARFGTDVDAIVGLHASALVSSGMLLPELLDSRMAAIDQVFCSGDPVRFEDERAGIIYQTSVYPIFDADRKVRHVAVFARDVTAQRQAEQRAVQVERLAAMGQLAGVLAEEINNPLQAILSNLEMVMDFDLGPDVSRERLGIALEEIQYLAKVAHGILEFTLPVEGTPRPVSVTQLMQRALTLARWQLEQAQVQVATTFPDQPIFVFATPNQMVQALFNLIVNAVELMPVGECLDVAVRASGDMVNLSFSSSGYRLAPGQVERLFDPFFADQVEEAGLGMWISRGIVKRNSGVILAQSLEDGQGAMFTVRLPIHSALD